MDVENKGFQTQPVSAEERFALERRCSNCIISLGIFAVDYANDITIISSGKFESTVYEVLQSPQAGGEMVYGGRGIR